MTLREIFYFSLLISVVYTVPQRNPQLLNDRIQNVFGAQNRQLTGQNRGGFGEIVLPEPENLVPTQSPQVINNNGASCKCVPYFNCQVTL